MTSNVVGDGDVEAGLSPRAIARSGLARPRGTTAIARPVICGLLRFFDWAWISLTAMLSIYIYTLVNPENRFNPLLFLLVGLVAAFSSNSLFEGLRLYEFTRLPQFGWELKRFLAGWAGVLFIGLSIGFLTKTSATFSRLWLMIWSVLAISGLLGARLVVGSLIARWTATDRLRRQVAIVGSGPSAQRLIAECRTSWPDEIHIVGVFDDRTRAPSEIEGVRVLGNIETLISLVRTTIIDEIMIAIPCSAPD